MNVGPTPVPTVTLPAIGLLDVTNGYVPWSISNITPCAPSKSTFSSATMHRLRFLMCLLQILLNVDLQHSILQRYHQMMDMFVSKHTFEICLFIFNV